MATRFLKILSKGNKILKSKLMIAPSYMIIFNFLFLFSIVEHVRHVQELSKRYNEALQVDIEQNMNNLYDGPFQRDIRQSPTSHLEIMDNSDYIFFNISEGLKAMDEIRLVFF